MIVKPVALPKTTRILGENGAEQWILISNTPHPLATGDSFTKYIGPFNSETKATTYADRNHLNAIAVKLEAP